MFSPRRRESWKDKYMNLVARTLATAALIAVDVMNTAPVRADDNGQQNAYVVTPLASDLSGKANVTDPNLKNSWGVAFTPSAGAFWISDNATGLSTLYDGAGTIVNLPNNATPVVIPCPPKAGQGSSCPNTASAAAWSGILRRRSWFQGQRCRQYSFGSPRTERYPFGAQA